MSYEKLSLSAIDGGGAISAAEFLRAQLDDRGISVIG